MMQKWMWLTSLLLLLSSPLSIAAEKAILLDVSGPIGPAMQDYIQRGLAYASKEQVVVRVLGEICGAHSRTMLKAGDKIRVTHINGLMLAVEALPEKKYKRLGE